MGVRLGLDAPSAGRRPRILVVDDATQALVKVLQQAVAAAMHGVAWVCSSATRA